MSAIHKTMLHVKPEKLCFHLTKKSCLKFPPHVKMVTDVERRHLWREKKPGKFLVFFFFLPACENAAGQHAGRRGDVWCDAYTVCSQVGSDAGNSAPVCFPNSDDFLV